MSEMDWMRDGISMEMGMSDEELEKADEHGRDVGHGNQKKEEWVKTKHTERKEKGSPVYRSRSRSSFHKKLSTLIKVFTILT
jgi:hypothetical protein